MILYLVIIPLFAVSLIRAPIAWKNPKARPLTWTFATLAAGLGVVQQGFMVDSYQVTHWAPLPDIAKAALGMIATACLLRWVVSVTPAAQDTVKPPRYHRLIADRTRRIVTAVALALSVGTGPFLTVPPPTRTGVDILASQNGDIPGTIHLGIFYLYLTFGAACCALMCVSTWSRDKRGFLGAGMGLMALGCITGTGYGLVRTFGLLDAVAGGNHASLSIVTILTTDLALISCLSLALGSLVPFGERIHRLTSAMQQLRRLRPLWRDITTAIPDVMLPGTKDTPVQDWIIPADVTNRLHRRRIEILDGIAQLRPWMPDDVRNALADATNTPEERDTCILVMATWIKHANFAADPEQTRAMLPPLDNDGQYLAKLSRALRPWPRDFAGRSTRIWADPRFTPALESLGLLSPEQEANA